MSTALWLTAGILAGVVIGRLIGWAPASTVYVLPEVDVQ